MARSGCAPGSVRTLCSLAAPRRHGKVRALIRTPRTTAGRPATSRVTSADHEALAAEQIVARTADLVLKVIGLAERYERGEPSEAGDARVLVLRTTAARGCELILSAAEPDGTPRSWVPCP